MFCAVCNRLVTADGLAVISATRPSRSASSSRLGSLNDAPLSSMFGLPGQAGDADIGLRRLGDRRQPVDLGVGDGDGRVEHVDIDAPDVANLRRR